MLIRRGVIITTLLVVIAVVVAGTLLESTPLAFSFVIAATTLQRPPSQQPHFFKPIKTSATARSYDNHGSKNITNCCVFQSLEFPSIALGLAEKLSIPFVTTTSLFMDTASDGGDTQQQQQQYQHAIVIEPYTYENRIHNYSIGIVSLNDPSNVSSNRNRKSGKRTMTKKMNPFQIDFMPPINSRLGRRTNGDSGQPDLLLKAVRLPPNQYHHNNYARITTNDELPTDDADRLPEQRPTVIYDITAGLGQDSLLIAHSLIKNKKNSNSTAGSAGYVHMIERNPIIATLLQDALRRLRLIAATSGSTTNDGDHQNMAQQLSQCLSMEYNDGFNALTNLQNHRNNDSMVPDVVYFDPMFPTRKKTALVKKNMLILHSLLLQDERTATNDDDGGDMWNKDEEESRLLQLAYQVARSRVVVKRPIHAPSIDISRCYSNTTTKTTIATTNTVKPSYQITGSINRWDVYNKK